GQVRPAFTQRQRRSRLTPASWPPRAGPDGSGASGGGGGGGRRAARRAGRAMVAAVAGVVTAVGVGDAAAGDDRVGDLAGEQPDGAQRIVVARDDEVDFVGIAVGVDDADDRDLELARLVDGNLFLAGVDHEDRVGQPAHVADAFQVLLELLL